MLGSQCWVAAAQRDCVPGISELVAETRKLVRGLKCVPSLLPFTCLTQPNLSSQNGVGNKADLMTLLGTCCTTSAQSSCLNWSYTSLWAAARLLSSGTSGPFARSMLPSLGETWWRNKDPRQVWNFPPVVVGVRSCFVIALFTRDGVQILLVLAIAVLTAYGTRWASTVNYYLNNYFLKNKTEH